MSGAFEASISSKPSGGSAEPEGFGVVEVTDTASGSGSLGRRRGRRLGGHRCGRRGLRYVGLHLRRCWGGRGSSLGGRGGSDRSLPTKRRRLSDRRERVLERGLDASPGVVERLLDLAAGGGQRRLGLVRDVLHVLLQLGD